jgi:hypothetical protein
MRDGGWGCFCSEHALASWPSSPGPFSRFSREKGRNRLGDSVHRRIDVGWHQVSGDSYEADSQPLEVLLPPEWCGRLAAPDSHDAAPTGSDLVLPLLPRQSGEGGRGDEGRAIPADTK